MRVGINALFQASGGSLTNLAQLLRDWHRAGSLDEHEVVLFGSGNSIDRLARVLPAEAMAKVRTIRFPASDRGLVARLIDEQWRLPRAVRDERIDVLFCPGNVIPYRARIPVVAAFQNAAPFCESVTARSIGLKQWLQFALLGIFMRMTAKYATKVIFISEFFRDLFAQRFRFPASRGTVILRACSDEHARPSEATEARLGIQRPFVLSVSHLNPYKNIVELVEAFAIASRAVPGRQLVLAGMSNFPRYLERIQETCAKHNFGPEQVLFTDEVPHDETLSLMKSCEAFVFTSTCENCPTALVEAMTLGVPTAASNVGVMPEIAGGAALLFDPYKPEEIADALTKLMRDPELRRELGHRAAERACTFPSRDEIARRTLETLASVVPAGARA